VSMPLTVCLLPKSTLNPYFEECYRGAEEAAWEVGFQLRWEGPSQPSAATQADVVRGWVREGLPVIAASVEHAGTLSPVLREARRRGIKVLTWDADAQPDARDFMVVPATAEAVVHALASEIGRLLGGRGAFAVITSSGTAPNQAIWLKQLRGRMARDYPQVELAAVGLCHDVEEEARREAGEILRAFPQVRVLVGLCSPAVPGAAAALAARPPGPRVAITGVSLPSSCRLQIAARVVDSVVIWNARKLGYLAAFAAHAAVTGVLQPGLSWLKAGRLGSVAVRENEVRLGRVHIVSAGNIGQFLG
jgi:ABC-type sugar transport system substrate-binding protein